MPLAASSGEHARTSDLGLRIRTVWIRVPPHLLRDFLQNNLSLPGRLKDDSSSPGVLFTPLPTIWCSRKSGLRCRLLETRNG